jgi:hypothetical protein
MDRSNPYEAAFETFLKEQGLCYVAVDETRRAVLGDVPVKNLDFIVLAPTGAKLLIDVKGRPCRGCGGHRHGESALRLAAMPKACVDGNMMTKP